MSLGRRWYSAGQVRLSVDGGQWASQNGAAMRLSTWHKPDFSLLAGRVERSKSEYVQTVKAIRPAYAELAVRLGTDQFIWCYTVPNQHFTVPSRTEVEWILDVPTAAVLRFVDDIVWNRILGVRCALPASIRFKWKDEAYRQFPRNAQRRHAAEKALEEAFWSQEPPRGSWWNVLFVEPQSGEMVTALVRHPVLPEWVLKNPFPAT